MSFKTAVRQQTIDVPSAALEFARSIAYPDLDVAHYLTELDELARAAQSSIGHHLETAARARALAAFLFQDEGFTGNTADYGNPANSFLNAVLDDRRGLPIALSVLYVAIGQRCQLPVYGVGMPGHFVAACSTPAGPLFIDAFNGGAELSPANCAQLVQSMTAQKLDFEQAWLNEFSAEDTLVRMLNNLRQAYVNRREWSLALKAVDQLQILHPARAAHWRTRGFIHLQAGELGAALRALEQFLCRAPGGSDAQVIRNACNQIRNSIARLN
ncbi:hypothetical protein LBMAG37_07040 [Anaerolineae bacterium]|nr:hypothetical protein EMGBS3_06050 [Anaerolineaceae bacterium]GBL38591.1 hypothetical protein EMGBD1_22780 [Anaerolineaceae bacterium]GDX67550.1 hypothetical protein LBMAG37_07040 [Anaerolineae bacterium]